MLQETLLIVLALLAGILVLATLAVRIHIPYAIMLVVGGALLGFVPGLPHITLDPELILLIFLPPLVYSSAWFTSWRDFRANLRAIALLAIGLVLVTTVLVAYVAHTLIPGMSWPVAFVLGAVVSPTDTVAATSIAKGLGISRTVVNIIEGESLVNDATGLVAYKFAVAAVVSGSFSLWQAGLQFILVSGGGILLGLVMAWLFIWILIHIDDAKREIPLTLMVPFIAYLLAEAINLSGVLAAVASGLYMGRKSATFFSPGTRLQADSFWHILVFVFNGLIFLLVGLQLRTLIEAIPGGLTPRLLWYATAISITVILARLGWVFTSTALLRLLNRLHYYSSQHIGWSNSLIVGWAGMRGGVSLAAALAIPFETSSGHPFPERPLVIHLTFSVILATLVVQGLSLGPLIRWLHIPVDRSLRQEVWEAHMVGTRAGLARLNELKDADWLPQDYAIRLHSHYEKKLHNITSYTEETEEKEVMEHFAAFQRLRHEVLQAERKAIIQLRNQNIIGDEALRRVEHNLDLEEQQLKI